MFGRWQKSAWLVLIGCLFSMADPVKILSQADSCYALRAEKAKGDKANRKHIDNTIRLYRSVLEDSLVSEKAALGLMRSEYFRIRFATKNDKERDKFVASAKALGDTLHSRFPNNRELTSLYATIYSMWGASIGPLKAVKQGAAARVRDLADSAKDFQILGRTHQLLPYIPLILPWPDKELALKYLNQYNTMSAYIPLYYTIFNNNVKFRINIPLIFKIIPVAPSIVVSSNGLETACLTASIVLFSPLPLPRPI